MGYRGFSSDDIHGYRQAQWTENSTSTALSPAQGISYPIGKAKLALILKRDHGWMFSESTIGRMLTLLMRKGLITKSISALRIKRNRTFVKGHAKPWSFKPYRDMVMGERAQIDHMNLCSLNSTTCGRGFLSLY